ncbi:androglobin-like isoform X4 [Harmonia axyridis]|uniref:androglobin-like isoform X4 n=1 Tax=Harmonia axyridis TaxID=115357 RepID=UPI001E275E0E|nr:androglobin-like isoform X4 [Harmonia axyridis]
MSEKAKPKNKPRRKNSGKSYDLVTCLPDPTNPRSFFFPEWADDEINLASVSSLLHGGKHKEKVDKSDKMEKGEKSEEFYRRFEDPQVLFLPFCLQDLEHDWKRPRNIFSEYQLVVYTEGEIGYSDLLKPSSHLVNSAFMRSFISSIHILEYLAFTTNFATEATTSKFVPNASGPWKPWHHIYGGSKAGAGTTHSPQVNTTGKYFVRLFWLGAWRKVVIDDYLPVDVTGHVLLPSLHIPPKPSSKIRFSTVEMKEKEKQKTQKPEKEAPLPEVVLWPFLLSKALLKLANLTMNKDKDLLDFNIVHCLTGWVLQKVELKGMPLKDMWEICKTYTKMYSWEDHEVIWQSPTVDKQKKDKKDATKEYLPFPENSNKSHYFMALCKDMRTSKQSVVNGISPCWGHEILIDEYRNIPLDRPPPDPQYPLWKKFRWMEWARSKRLIEDPVAMDTTRYVRCVSPFKKYTELVVNKEPSQDEKIMQFPLRKSLAAAQRMQLNPEKETKGADNDIRTGPDLYRIDKSKERKSIQEPPPNPNIWSLQEKIICERAATKLQSFFKGVQIRILLKRHSPGNDYFPEICETLRNMYREHFSLERRDECLGSIIRNFFKNSKISDLLCFYEISRDFKWDLMVQTYTGSSELTRDYVILCRYILRCHTDVVLSIELFSSLTNYALRIIDNDTGVEIYRFSNRVFPGIYKPNTYGYTIIGFAWYKDVMLINWKLAVISSRTTANAFEIEEVKTTTTMAFDHYVPICKGLIGKHSIFVRENVIFTFRFSCSFKDVKFNIRLLDTTQNPIVDIVGTEKFIIPSILLKYSASSEMAPHMVKTRSSKSLLVPRSSGRYIRGDSRKSMERPSSKKESISARKVKDTNMEMSSVTEFEPHVYSLEFYVLDNSWPLTKMEWEVVRKLREDMYFINANKETELVIKESSSKSIVKSAKDTRKSMLKKVQSIEKPWYLLQYSLKSNAQVALVKDKSEEDKLYNLKKSWYQMDADRYSRSFELRQKYLRKYTDPGCECPEEYLNPTPTASIGRMTDMSFETTTNSGPLREEDDENESRSITCPKWTEADVPPFDLTPYYRPQCPCPLDLRRKIIKTEEDHIVAREERLQMIEEYNTLLAKKRYDMELWINESNERRTLVFLWYADCRKASERIFQEDHVMRQNFIDKWTAELSGPAKQDKKGPSKTDKK